MTNYQTVRNVFEFQKLNDRQSTLKREAEVTLGG